MFANTLNKKSVIMCKHRYILIKTRIVKIGTHFSKRQITTEYYQCKECHKKKFVKKEMMLDKMEIPPLTILDNMN